MVSRSGAGRNEGQPPSDTPLRHDNIDRGPHAAICDGLFCPATEVSFSRVKRRAHSAQIRIYKLVKGSVALNPILPDIPTRPLQMIVNNNEGKRPREAFGRSWDGRTPLFCPAKRKANLVTVSGRKPCLADTCR